MFTTFSYAAGATSPFHQQPLGHSARADSWCKRLIYKRECQEHFSPSAGCAGLFRDIQPLSPEKTLVWCRALGCSISAAASFLVATTPIGFETYQAVRLYGVNH